MLTLSKVVIPRYNINYTEAESLEGLQLSEAEYWENYYEDTSYEWNNGYLEVKPVSDFITGQLYNWFVSLLQHYLATNPIADIIGLEFGFRAQLPTKTVIRKPDLGIVCRNNPIKLMPKDRHYRGIFDICIEALSDSTKSERDRDLVQKKREYAAAGVPEYYILHSEAANCYFYTLNSHSEYVDMPVSADGIIRSQVLPGFGWRPEDLVKLPDLDTLRHDSWYSQFVTPQWQQEELLRQQAEQQAKSEASMRRQAEQQAKSEASMRHQAEQRAQLLAARLRALGIDPEIN